MFLGQSSHWWPRTRSAAFVPPRTETDQADACNVEGDHVTARFLGLHHPGCFLDQLHPCPGVGRFDQAMVGRHRHSYSRRVACLDHWLLRQ